VGSDNKIDQHSPWRVTSRFSAAVCISGEAQCGLVPSFFTDQEIANNVCLMQKPVDQIRRDTGNSIQFAVNRGTDNKTALPQRLSKLRHGRCCGRLGHPQSRNDVGINCGYQAALRSVFITEVGQPFFGIERPFQFLRKNACVLVERVLTFPGPGDDCLGSSLSELDFVALSKAHFPADLGRHRNLSFARHPALETHGITFSPEVIP
jgi:hypothetical protein